MLSVVSVNGVVLLEHVFSCLTDCVFDDVENSIGLWFPIEVSNDFLLIFFKFACDGLGGTVVVIDGKVKFADDSLVDPGELSFVV